MAEHELEKLLGGFAADQLTPDERSLLFTAALHDQQLFNALADEQALKELLADPAVRRRLLESLHQIEAAGVGGSRTWLEWFRRPTGLAWAYGLAAAVFSVVIGTTIYQDSLRQASRSVATEETAPPASHPAPLSSQPLPPQSAEPQSKTKENAAPGTTAKKDSLFDKTAKLERSVPSKPQEPPSSDARDTLKPSEQDAVRQQDHVPMPGSGQAQDEKAASPDQTSPTKHSAPPSAMLEPTPMQGLANAPAAVAPAGPTLSARALFYSSSLEPAAEEERRSQSTVSDETSAGRMMAEAPRKERKRAEPSSGLLGTLERAPSAGKPLGVRYSLIMAGPGGIDMEVDPATPVGKDNLPRLAIQTTEPGYLYVLEEPDSSGKRTLLFPTSGNARITGRTTIPVALSGLFREEPASGQSRLLLVLSRTPQDVVNMMPSVKRASPLLIEQVDPSQPEAKAEQAVYVMSQDPSLALLSVEIPLSVR